ncbi:MAG: hypothetical protein WA160_09160 [Pseudobdellovibrio sp.]
MKSISTLLLALVISAVGFANKSNANEPPNSPNHSQTVCAEINSTICAHLNFISSLDTSTEGEFIVHALIPNNIAINNLKVSLWMPSMGHGSSPVDILPLDETNYFKISNAWFVMTGDWIVRIEFESNGSVFEINIPVMIEN